MDRFNPLDCPEHTAMKAKTTRLCKDIEKEVTDRKRVDDLIVGNMHKDFVAVRDEITKSMESARKEFVESMNEMRKSIMNETEMRMKLFQQEMEDFKLSTEKTMKSFRNLTIGFMLASIGLWGTVIALIVHLAEKIK